MLVKLFKHDFKALSRTLGPVLIAIGAAAILGFINTLLVFGEHSLLTEADSMIGTGIGMTAMAGLILVAMALAAAVTVFAVLIFVRFYRSMVTDEAYLTFTLPISAGKLIAGKFLVALVWMVIGGVAVALAGCVILSGVALADMDYSFVEAWRIFRDFMSAFISEIGGGRTVLICILAVVSMLRWYFQVTGAILFGASIVRKNKALAAVGMIFVVNFVVNLILSLFGVSTISLRMLAPNFGDDVISITAWLIIQIAVNVLIAAAFWWMNVRIAKKSVNIE